LFDIPAIELDESSVFGEAFGAEAWTGRARRGKGKQDALDLYAPGLCELGVELVYSLDGLLRRPPTVSLAARTARVL